MAVCDLIATGAKVLYAPLSTGLPADTVAAGAAWPAGWVDFGYTSEPTKLIYESEELDHMVEQELGAVRRQRVEEKASLETVLAEITLTNLSVAWDNTVSSTPAGVGQPGKEELVVGGSAGLTERMWGIEGKYVDEDGATFPVRVFVWKGTGVTGGELQFSRKDATGIPLKVGMLIDTTKAAGQKFFKIQKILEPAT